MLATAGPFMPETAGLRYHVISMEWFNSWKQYVEYDKHFQEESKKTKKDELSEEFNQHHNSQKQVTDAVQEPQHPGIINSDLQLDKIKTGPEVPMLSHDKLDDI